MLPAPVSPDFGCGVSQPGFGGKLGVTPARAARFAFFGHRGWPLEQSEDDPERVQPRRPAVAGRTRLPFGLSSGRASIRRSLACHPSGHGSGANPFPAGRLSRIDPRPKTLPRHRFLRPRPAACRGQATRETCSGPSASITPLAQRNVGSRRPSPSFAQGSSSFTVRLATSHLGRQVFDPLPISRLRLALLQDRNCHRSRHLPSAIRAYAPVNNVDNGDECATAILVVFSS